MSGIKKIVNSQMRSLRRPNAAVASTRKDPAVHWLLKSLDETLEEVNESSKASSGVFHPSALGNPCDRGLYLHFHGLLVDHIDAHVRRIFDNGNYLGYRYEAYFKKMGVLVASEVPVNSIEPPIRGRLDFHIQVPGAPRFVVELKSINDRGFQSVIKNNDAKSDHKIQLQVYLNLFDSPGGGVLYENKNTQDVALFVVQRDTKVWQEIVDRCFRVANLSTLPLLNSVENIHDKKYCGCLQVADD